MFKMFKTITDPANCEIRAVIRILNARNVKPAEIYRQVKDIYGENAMTGWMVKNLVGKFEKKIHDNARSGRPSSVNNDIVKESW